MIVFLENHKFVQILSCFQIQPDVQISTNNWQSCAEHKFVVEQVLQCDTSNTVVSCNLTSLDWDSCATHTCLYQCFAIINGVYLLFSGRCRAQCFLSRVTLAVWMVKWCKSIITSIPEGQKAVSYSQPYITNSALCHRLTLSDLFLYAPCLEVIQQAMRLLMSSVGRPEKGPKSSVHPFIIMFF